MPNALSLLLKSRKFWIAVLALVKTIVLHLIPNFPKDIWLAIDALVDVILIAIVADDASNGQIRNVKALFARKK